MSGHSLPPRKSIYFPQERDESSALESFEEQK